MIAAKRPAAVWSAHVVTAIMLVYAVAKVVHALDGRLGIPGGPVVAPERYDTAGNVALQQFGLVAMGLLAAALAQATVRRWGRRIPSGLLVAALVVGLLAVAAGAIAIVGALFGPEPLRWTQVPAAMLVVVATGCWAVMTWATVATHRRRRERDGARRPSG